MPTTFNGSLQPVIAPAGRGATRPVGRATPTTTRAGSACGAAPRSRPRRTPATSRPASVQRRVAPRTPTRTTRLEAARARPRPTLEGGSGDARRGRHPQPGRAGGQRVRRLPRRASRGDVRAGRQHHLAAVAHRSRPGAQRRAGRGRRAEHLAVAGPARASGITDPQGVLKWLLTTTRREAWAVSKRSRREDVREDMGDALPRRRRRPATSRPTPWCAARSRACCGGTSRTCPSAASSCCG